MAESPRAVACRHVYRKFKAMEGVKPSVQAAGPNRVFTFRRSDATSPGGPSISQIVRVTVDPEGRILRVVASR
ncbi:MAG: hypothetical protein H6648_08625 [Caldilineae bacterium]|nr:hypothetical protein [Chloroflexota bacterium]MCB9177210.1 hypothetical protein [Caldilineae bacterium]